MEGQEGLATCPGGRRRPPGEGQSCEYSGVAELEPCAPDLFCDPDTHVCRRPASEGESCDVQLSLCGWTLACIDGTCQKPRGKGAPCTVQRQCKQELFCDADSGTPGTCQPLARQDEDCTTRACEYRLYCAEASRTCQLRQQLGESCADEPLSCVQGTSCSQGTCGGLDPKRACPSLSGALP